MIDVECSQRRIELIQSNKEGQSRVDIGVAESSQSAEAGRKMFESGVEGGAKENKVDDV